MSARDERNEAIEAVGEAADRASPYWTERACEAIQTFARKRWPEPFLIEDVRAANCIEPPHDERAWGAAAQKASRRGLIVRIGFAPAKSSHLSPKPVWRAA